MNCSDGTVPPPPPSSVVEEADKDEGRKEAVGEVERPDSGGSFKYLCHVGAKSTGEGGRVGKFKKTEILMTCRLHCNCELHENYQRLLVQGYR